MIWDTSCWVSFWASWWYVPQQIHKKRWNIHSNSSFFYIQFKPTPLAASHLRSIYSLPTVISASWRIAPTSLKKMRIKNRKPMQKTMRQYQFSQMLSAWWRSSHRISIAFAWSSLVEATSNLDAPDDYWWWWTSHTDRRRFIDAHHTLRTWWSARNA